MKSLVDEIVQVLWSRFLRVLEGVADELENGINFQQLQRAVRKELDGLGRDILVRGACDRPVVPKERRLV